MKIAIHTQSQSEYSELMEHLEEKGYEWETGQAPTNQDYFDEYKDQTVICIDDMYITYCRYTFAVNDEYTIIPFYELKDNNYKIEIQL